MRGKGPIKAVGIVEILDESDYGYKVILEKSGKEIWINRRLIEDAAPKSLFVPEWYYNKEIAPLEDLPQSEIPF